MNPIIQNRAIHQNICERIPQTSAKDRSTTVQKTMNTLLNRYNHAPVSREMFEDISEVSARKLVARAFSARGEPVMGKVLVQRSQEFLAILEA